MLTRSIRGGDGDRSRSLSMILSRIRTGDGDRSRTLSRVSITRLRSLSGGGDGDRSVITLVRTRSIGGGDRDLSLSIILSRIRTGDGDRGLRSAGLVNVSVSRSLNTTGPASGRLP